MSYHVTDLRFIYQVAIHVYLSTYGKGLVYFAVQTRKAELIEQRLMEIERIKAHVQNYRRQKNIFPESFMNVGLTAKGSL